MTSNHGPGHASPRHRRVSHRVQVRRRIAVGLLGLVVLAIVLALVLPGGSSGRPGQRTSAGPTTTEAAASGGRSSTAGPGGSQSAKATHSIPAIEAGVLPWGLTAPISREVVLPGNGSGLTIVGGLAASQSSLASVFSLDTASGLTTPLGTLPSAVHDAAGALIEGRGYVFGGGSPNTVATVQQFGAPGPTPPAPPTPKPKKAAHTTTASTAKPVTPTTVPSPPAVVGQLPQPRSDPQAVTIGTTTFVIGGYDGTKPDPDVLATTDGRRFSVVAKLPVSVRYPAVAALGNVIYVFGGQAVGGPQSGQATDTIQEIVPSASKATVVGHLPEPLAAASAAVLGGHIYVAGGVTSTAGSTSPAIATIWAYDPAHHKVLNAGTLPVPTSYAAIAVLAGRAWIIGGESSGNVMNSIEMMIPNPSFGTAGMKGAGSPYFGGQLLVADRGNDRLLLLNTQNQVVWNYPSVYAPPPPGGFYFPDDAFFTKNGAQIISNQENNETVVMIGFPSGQLQWSYGHARQAGSLPGYLHTPDDAYLLKNGQVTVADAENCRVLFINPNGSIASQIGTTGNCVHSPPSSLGSPNGDTPLADGNVLISEINGSWVSEYTPQGKLVWTVSLPVGYPSDPQQLGPDLYLLSDYSHPGGFIEFTREGQVTYRYQPGAGQGEMNQPSLTEVLPSGVFMTNDDYRDRMVAVDPVTQALVWQYGVTDSPGTAPGYLNTPDGFDLLMDNKTLPLHPLTG